MWDMGWLVGQARLGAQGGRTKWKRKKRLLFWKKRHPAWGSKKLLFAESCGGAGDQFAIVLLAFRKCAGRRSCGHNEMWVWGMGSKLVNEPAFSESFSFPRAGRLFSKKEALGLLS
jgi:hypothetical protein